MVREEVDNKHLINSIGRNIAVFRRNKQMSQEQLAHKVGISSKQLSKYEIGKNRIAVDRLVRISQILNVQVNEFLPKSSNDNFQERRNIKNDFSKFKKLSGEELLKIISNLID